MRTVTVLLASIYSGNELSHLADKGFIQTDPSACTFQFF